MTTMAAPGQETEEASNERDELRAFMLVVRQALLMVVRYIERRYGLKNMH